MLCIYASITFSEGPTPRCKRVATTILPQVSETVIRKPTNTEVLLYNSINTSISNQLILIFWTTSRWSMMQATALYCKAFGIINWIQLAFLQNYRNSVKKQQWMLVLYIEKQQLKGKFTYHYEHSSWLHLSSQFLTQKLLLKLLASGIKKKCYWETYCLHHQGKHMCTDHGDLTKQQYISTRLYSIIFQKIVIFIILLW